MKEMQFDNYGKGFENYQEFHDAVNAMEKETVWIPRVKTADIRIRAISDPLEVQQYLGNMGMSDELVYETSESGTRLICSYGDKSYLIRDTGMRSLFESAKISGQVLGRLSPEERAQVLNICLPKARGNSLLLFRCGKVGAFHSDNNGGYQVLSMPELLNVTTDELQSRFGNVEFTSGYHAHDIATATWELPDAQSEMLDMYQQALERVRVKHGINFMPCVLWSSSDTGIGAATLTPVFRRSNGALLFFTKPIAVKHIRSNGSGMERYKKEIANIYGAFENMTAKIEQMAKTTISNPGNALIAMCKRVGIPKKYASKCLEDLERLTGGRPCTMHDVYLSICDVTMYAAKEEVSGVKLNSLSEAVYKITNMHWKDYDIYGTVAWAA